MSHMKYILILILSITVLACKSNNNDEKNTTEKEKAKVENRCSDGWGKGLHSEQYLLASI